MLCYVKNPEVPICAKVFCFRRTMNRRTRICFTRYIVKKRDVTKDTFYFSYIVGRNLQKIIVWGHCNHLSVNISS